MLIIIIIIIVIIVTILWAYHIQLILLTSTISKR